MQYEVDTRETGAQLLTLAQPHQALYQVFCSPIYRIYRSCDTSEHVSATQYTRLGDVSSPTTKIMRPAASVFVRRSFACICVISQTHAMRRISSNMNHVHEKSVYSLRARAETLIDKRSSPNDRFYSFTVQTRHYVQCRHLQYFTMIILCVNGLRAEKVSSNTYGRIVTFSERISIWTRKNISNSWE